MLAKLTVLHQHENVAVKGIDVSLMQVVELRESYEALESPFT